MKNDIELRLYDPDDGDQCFYHVRWKWTLLAALESAASRLKTYKTERPRAYLALVFH